MESARHPLRMVWTLIVTALLFYAVRPLPHDLHGFWLHAQSWFLGNQQQDYGEGPLFNQEVILYHMLFTHGYHGPGVYTLDNQPPFTVGNYPPVFALTAAIFMHWVGVTFTAGRLVSSLAIVGSCIMLFAIVLQGTGQILPAVLAGGLLPTFSGIFTWGPYNRVDSLALFWSLCTVFIALRFARTRWIWIIVPFALLTIYTRQSLVDGIVAAYCYLLFRDWRRGLLVGAVTVALGFAIFVGLEAWTHGAFYLNAVVDNENAFNFGNVLGSWRSFMSQQGGRFVFRLAVAGAVAGLFGTGSILWAIWLVGSVFVFATIGKVGSSVNYYFPLYAATAACAGVFVGRFRSFFRRAPFFLWPAELLLPVMLVLYVHGTVPKWVNTVPLAPRVLALVGHPTANQSAAAKNANATFDPRWRYTGTPRLITYLSEVQGPVLGSDFPWGVAVQAGHTMQWQPFELGQAFADGTWDPQPFLTAVRDRYYAAIFGHNPYSVGTGIGQWGYQITEAIRGNYHAVTSIDGYAILERNGPPVALPGPFPEKVPHPIQGLTGALEKVVVR